MPVMQKMQNNRDFPLIRKRLTDTEKSIKDCRFRFGTGEIDRKTFDITIQAWRKDSPRLPLYNKEKAFSIWGLNTFLVFPYKPFGFNTKCSCKYTDFFDTRKLS